MQTYSWRSGGVWYIEEAPQQDPGEDERDYATRLAVFILHCHKQHPPDRRR